MLAVAVAEAILVGLVVQGLVETVLITQRALDQELQTQVAEAVVQEIMGTADRPQAAQAAPA
jgi:hypothetical protein